MGHNSANKGNDKELAAKKAEQREESFRSATSATIRAISGKDVTFDYKTNNPYDNKTSSEDSVSIERRDSELTPEEVVRIRGQADKRAMRLRHSDNAIHDRLTPTSKEAAALFERLEQARCEALGGRDYVGSKRNIGKHLKQQFEEAAIDYSQYNSLERASDALYLMARQSLSGQKPPKPSQGLLSYWKPKLQDALGKHPFKELKKSLDDQESYALAALKLLHDMDYDVELPEMPSPDDSDDNDKSKKKNDQGQGEKEPGNNMAQPDKGEDGKPDQNNPYDAGSYEDLMAKEMDADDTIDMDDAYGDGAFENMEVVVESAGSGNEDSPLEARTPPASSERQNGYRVFTTEFDRTVKASELEPSFEKRGVYAEALKKLVDKEAKTIGRLANKLQRKLQAKEMNYLRSNQDLDEGILDTTRLSRIFTTPLNPLCYKTENEYEYKDTIVTVLVDNSGSMRGEPIKLAAVSSYVLARTMERCGVKVEILGFTTSAWRGGNSREKWSQSGQPDHPGRLNDLLHVIYKSAELPVRRSKNSMAAMLKETILKENIDGEALEWACGRMRSRPEQRRILMVVSDGAPMDDCTAAANKNGYLEKHLHDVIAEIEQQGDIELLAIGIGHDVSKFYKNAIYIPNAQALGPTMIDELDKLFDKDGLEKRRGRRKNAPAPKSP